MESPPCTPKSWWNILGDQPSDEKSQTIHRASGGGSWWSSLIVENPSDELEKQRTPVNRTRSHSADENKSHLGRSLLQAKSVESRKQVQWKLPLEQHHGTADSDDELFDFAGLCNYEMDEAAMKLFDYDLRGSLEQFDHPALAKILDPDHNSVNPSEEKPEIERYAVAGENEVGNPIVSEVIIRGKSSKKLQAGEIPDAVDQLSKDMSSLTSIYLGDEHTSMRSCISPMLQRKFAALKNIKLSKTASTVSSHSSTRSQVIARTASKESTAIRGSFSYSYDFESNRNAYVAFFRRGPIPMESLRYYEQPTPQSFPTFDSEIVVSVEACTVSRVDCEVRKGNWWGEGSKRELNLPIVPGIAFAGKIVQLNKSSALSGLRMGDRVLSLVRNGANARHICIAKDRVVKAPPGISDPALLAVLADTYLAAFQVLHMGIEGSLRYRKSSLQGKSILIVGGATNMAKAITEMAVVAGAGTVYCPARDSRHEMVETWGAVPLKKDPSHWYSLLLGRLDMIIAVDTENGSTTELRKEHVQLLQRGGKVTLLVPPETMDASVSVEALSDERDLSMFKYNVFDAWEQDPKKAKRDLVHLIKALGENKVQPRVIDRIPLRKIAKAHDILDRKNVHGFIICEPWIKNKEIDMEEVRKVVEDTAVAAKGETGSESGDTSEEHASLNATRLHRPREIPKPSWRNVLSPRMSLRSPKTAVTNRREQLFHDKKDDERQQNNRRAWRNVLSPRVTKQEMDTPKSAPPMRKRSLKNVPTSPTSPTMDALWNEFMDENAEVDSRLFTGPTRRYV